ncbi:MAG: hypothetical protein EAZ57_09610 [Cytophagales bacterium]|nr:MAG: hypothetical protein EAZ67_01360 [Cytophagales bacterium]TAF59894.1 MAG: hypothetical protein EAZ57_09610 [Cytophagales bacterium]
MKKILVIAFGAMLWSCGSNTSSTENTAVTTSNSENVATAGAFDFAAFKIGKAQLGPIKIGMDVAEAEKLFSGLTKETDEGGNFGYGGGSPSYLYYKDKELVFGLVPEMNEDKIFAIMAIHPNLQTESGLTPNSSVGDILKVYPNLDVNYSEMNEWEFMEDTENNWSFVFMTEKGKQISTHAGTGLALKPQNKDIKANWVAIE